MRGEIPRGETWLTTPGQMRRGARRQRLIFGPCPTKAGPMMNIAIMARNVVGASLLLAPAAALGGCDAAPPPDSTPPLGGARNEIRRAAGGARGSEDGEIYGVTEKF